MHARMARMPPELQHVRSTLKRLSLAGNELVTLPADLLAQTSHLRWIDLSGNQLTSLACARVCDLRP